MNSSYQDLSDFYYDSYDTDSYDADSYDADSYERTEDSSYADYDYDYTTPQNNVYHVLTEWDPQDRFFSHVIFALTWTWAAVFAGVAVGILVWLSIASLSSTYYCYFGAGRRRGRTAQDEEQPPTATVPTAPVLPVTRLADRQDRMQGRDENVDIVTRF